MKSRYWALLPVLFMLSACQARFQPQEPSTPDPQTTDKVETTPVVEVVVETEEVRGEKEEIPICPSQTAVNPIGESIADEYDFVTYDDVMAWFCEGAAFEDIVVALETEALTDTPAEEMLQMLADGFTWEEIWFVVGLE